MILTTIHGQTLKVFNPSISFTAIIFPGLLAMLLQHSLLIACIRVNMAMKSMYGGKTLLALRLGELTALLPIWLFLSIALFVLWP